MRRLAAAAYSLVLSAAVAACGSGNSATATGSAGAARVDRGQTETLRLVTQTQSIASEMYDATRNLASHALPVAETRTELKRLAARASELANAAREQLPDTDPARPLIAAADERLVAVATTLREPGAASAGRDVLLSVDDPLASLRVHVGRIARGVTPGARGHIAQDLADLREEAAALGPTSTG